MKPYTRLTSEDPADDNFACTDAETGQQHAARAGMQGALATSSAGHSVGGRPAKFPCSADTCWGVSFLLTLILSTVYAIFSLGLIMLLMACDAGCSDAAQHVLTVAILVGVVGGPVASIFSCVYTLRNRPHRPWYMKYTINLAPVLVHFLSVFFLLFVFDIVNASYQGSLAASRA